MNMKDGYVYAMSNPTMSCLIVSCTIDPKKRLNDANNSGSFTVPSFKYEIIKKVTNYEEKEKLIHNNIKKDRVINNREFFNTNIEHLRTVFDLVEGEYLPINEENNKNENNNVINEKNNKKRDMKKIFVEGQEIRHNIKKINDTLIGKYNLTENKIYHDNKTYNSPSAFAMEHYKEKRPERSSKANGWDECEIEQNGEWIKLYSIEVND